MIEPYVAVAVQSTIWGTTDRKGVRKNLNHLFELMGTRIHVLSTEFPVRLIALSELALQSMQSEAIDMDHITFARELAIKIPGEETDMLAEKAIHHDTYIAAHAKALDEDFHNRYFSVSFVVSPAGKIVLKHYKCQMWVNEPSLTPHDIWELWIEKRGDDLQSLFPVVDTDIGRIGALVSMEGAYPETARALAMNGAEIIYRPSFPSPWANRPNYFEGWFAIQNKARALDNSCYVIAPNTGPYFPTTSYEGPGRADVGGSMIVGYTGEILGCLPHGNEGLLAAPIDIDSLRRFREKSMIGNWLKDLRTELYRQIYSRQIFPKNLWLTSPPGSRSEFRKIFANQIKKLLDDGIWVRSR